jgi:hypothetical protein
LPVARAERCSSHRICDRWESDPTILPPDTQHPGPRETEPTALPGAGVLACMCIRIFLDGHVEVWDYGMSGAGPCGGARLSVCVLMLLVIVGSVRNVGVVVEVAMQTLRLHALEHCEWWWLY